MNFLNLIRKVLLSRFFAPSIDKSISFTIDYIISPQLYTRKIFEIHKTLQLKGFFGILRNQNYTVKDFRLNFEQHVMSFFLIPTFVFVPVAII